MYWVISGLWGGCGVVRCLSAGAPGWLLNQLRVQGVESMGSRCWGSGVEVGEAAMELPILGIYWLLGWGWESGRAAFPRVDIFLVSFLWPPKSLGAHGDNFLIPTGLGVCRTQHPSGTPPHTHTTLGISFPHIQQDSGGSWESDPASPRGLENAPKACHLVLSEAMVTPAKSSTW